MSKWKVVFTKESADDIPYVKAAKLENKLKEIVDTLRDDPFQESQHFEQLKGDLKGSCSRRLNHKHRVVYQILKNQKTVKIVSVWTHYQQ
ncbi:MAG: Txe/YoeB family addiction module toxin [Ignavibacteriaceae bacterium]|nr:Txe/YoeB family addiction module toxin [Ignavibacteriaceae bacterium]